MADTGDLSLAMATAQEVASANRVYGLPLTLAAGDFVFGRTTKSTATGKWEFTPSGTPTNALRLTGRRTEGSADGPVDLFFSGTLGHKFEPTVSATAMFVLVDICLVLDRSSSMKLATTSTAGGLSLSDPRTCQPPLPDSRWIALDSAVSVFVSQLDTSLADEHVAVVTFAGGISSPCGEINTENSVDQPLTPDLSLVTAALTARSNSIWNGSTKIKEGIQLARFVLTGADARPTAAKIVIVLTDGVYDSADPVPEVRAAYDVDDITVHTITFGAGANQADMQAVAAAGHGHHYHAPDPSTLNDVFYDLAGTITILTE